VEKTKNYFNRKKYEKLYHDICYDVLFGTISSKEGISEIEYIEKIINE
jgi:hypothetical protein